MGRQPRQSSQDRPVTVKQVSKVAGVSLSTVSRILNGTARVAPEKHEAVQKAIAQLGYRPNLIAKQLAGGQSNIIGVLTQDITSPFYNDALGSIEQGLLQHKYAMMTISGHWQPKDESHALELLRERRVDGVIVLGGTLTEAQFNTLTVPMVVLGHRYQPRNNVVYLNLDNYSGAYNAVKYLIDAGHKHIAHIMGVPEHPDAQDRLAGYKQALADHNIPLNPNLIMQGDFYEGAGLLAMSRLLEQNLPLTAVFCANDQIAYGARLLLYRKGIRVPEDISLVGFDDLYGSTYTTPPLTSVRQPLQQLGHIMANAVLAMIRGETVNPEVPPLELVVRESTNFVRR